MLERLQVAVELTDVHDAVEVGGSVVVVEDQVAVGRPVADVSGGGVVTVGRAVERQLTGEGSGLFGVVVVAEGEGQWQLVGEIARGGVVGEPAGELRVAEGDPYRCAVPVAGAGDRTG